MSFQPEEIDADVDYYRVSLSLSLSLSLYISMDHLFIHCFDTKSSSMLVGMQVGLCCTKNTGEIFALKKLRKSDMLRQGQVRPC